MWLDVRALIEKARTDVGTAASADERRFRDELLTTVFEGSPMNGAAWRAVRLAFELGRLYELCRELGARQLGELTDYARILGRLNSLR